MSKERVETFSDAVFAIVLTLLVLTLQPPDIAVHSSLGQYAAAMAPLIPKFVSFTLSFVIIAINWVGHHYLFRRIGNATIGLVWLNNLVLFWICILPFPTAMLGDHPTDQFPILLYGVVNLLGALSFYALRHYASYAKLFEAESEFERRALGPTHSIPAITLYALSILLSFVSAYLALACLFLVPVLYFVPNMIRFR